MIPRQAVGRAQTVLASTGYRKSLGFYGSGKPKFVSSKMATWLEALPGRYGEVLPHVRLVSTTPRSAALRVDDRAGMTVDVTQSAVAISVDLHYDLNLLYGSAIGDKPPEDLWWARVQPSAIGGLSILHALDLQWVLPYRLYYDLFCFRESPWRALADVMRLVVAIGIDEEALLNLASTYASMARPVYWVYRYVAERLPAVIGESFLVELGRLPGADLSDFGPMGHLLRLRTDEGAVRLPEAASSG